MTTTKQSDIEGVSGPLQANAQSNNEQKTEVMCWKDPFKVCKCEQPQQGVYCGRYPIPTD
ncbi:MAG: hypothetical protein KZQ79_10375 [Candidatus Thiodiazotropha sp. (ex Lucinoma borealis)]|nr:hypothetical protein [Candidatus Thiodiazotropha sp. (ex Lucinoma borealis)]MCU7873097.1 hypothetical protein [Candidatus Thiodiazotropha sp. (ex Lucinoma borealis)]